MSNKCVLNAVEQTWLYNDGKGHTYRDVSPTASPSWYESRCSDRTAFYQTIQRHKALVIVYNIFMTKTALSLTPKEIDAYRRAASLIKPKRRETVKARRMRAWQVARKAARILKADFGAEKVTVFGSLLHPVLFHERSDVDLAVWGLRGRAYYRAVSVLLDIEPSISVDLIAFEDVRPALQGVILREGRGL